MIHRLLRHPTRLLAACAIAAAAACVRPAPPAHPSVGPEYVQLGGLELSALVEQDLEDVFATAQMMNAGDQPLDVEYGGLCGLSLLLFSEGSAAPVWDAARLGPVPCSAPADRFQIPPRTLARVLTPLLPGATILGDSLAPGPYRAAVRLRMLQPVDTTLLLPAGTLQLF